VASVKSFAAVARAPFLLLSVTLVASGAAAAAYEGHFSWLNTLLALVGLVVLHAAVDALNEWSDMRTGLDLETKRTPFSGGSGTLPSGGMSPGTALAFGLAASAVGLAIGIWFYLQIGSSILPIVIVGAICVLLYTDVLARMGIGEIAAGLGLGNLPVMGTALVQGGILGNAAIAASIPAFFMTFNLLLLNEFPDETADREHGRRNVIIMFGRKPAAMIYAVAALLTPASIVVAVIAGFLPMISLAALLPSLLLLKPLGWAFADPTQEVPIPALGANVMWILGTNTLLAVTFVTAMHM
jgi:1,4-dihydroxy-2-naphthoate octaprenyltransferase